MCCDRGVTTPPGAAGQTWRELFGCPLAIFELRGRTWSWVALYLALATAVLGTCAALAWRYQADLHDAVLRFLFPAWWHGAVDVLVDRFLAERLHVLAANTLSGVAMFAVTILLFPVKEQVSASYERTAHLVADPIEELPLVLQAWQEAKVFLGFLAAQGTAFWIGYQPDPRWQLAARILSYLVLFTACAIDFLSPLLQRHRGYYSQVVKTLARHPLPSLLFGAFFSLPTILVGQWWARHPEWPLGRAVALLFATAIVTVVWAQIAGTRLAAAMFPTFRRTTRSLGVVRAAAWLAMIGLLAGNALLFGAVGTALAKKTQVFQCQYDVHWSSLSFDRPHLADLLARKATVGAHIDLEIRNPTGLPVELEDNHLEIAHHGTRVATTRLDPLRIPAGGAVTQRVGFQLEVDPALVLRGRDLLDGDAWTFTLYLRVTPPIGPAFDFPVYLTAPRSS